MKRKHVSLSIMPTLLLASILTCPAEADVVTEQIPSLEVTDMDPDFAPKLGTYTYSFHWLFKTGARSQVRIAKEGDEYHMQTTAKTGKLVDLIYKVRYQGEAVLSADSLTPMKIEVKETVRSTDKLTTMKYNNGNIKATRIRKKKDRSEASVRAKEVDTKEGRIMDYFSAVLIARAIKWEKGVKRFIEVFDGRDLNNVSLECLGQQQVKYKKEKIDAWHIKVNVVQLGEVDADDELIAENIHLYLTSDKSREIVRIEADTPFGDLKVKLDEFEEAETSIDRQYSKL